MLKLVFGRAGSGKTSSAMEHFKAKMESGAVNLYFIVPEQYSHEAERSLLAICGDRLSLHGEVLSFSRLASRVLAELGGIGARVLDNGGRLLLMSRAISAVSGRLRIYAKNEQTPDFLEKLTALSKEFKSAGVTPDALFTAAQSSVSPLKEKLSDLSLILGAYDAYFTRETANPDDRLDRLAECVADSSIFEGGHVFLDGFTDFTAQELRVIEALLKKQVDMTVCLTCDGLDDGEEIFEPSRKTALKLKRMAADSGSAVAALRLEDNDCRMVCGRTPCGRKAEALRHLEKNLFSYGSAPFEGDCGAVRLFEASTPEDECEFAASTVLSLLREGYRLRDIAVAVCAWDSYGALAENIFQKYGVPVFVSGKSDINEKPPVFLLEKALEIVSGGWEYESVFAYLKTGLLGIAQEDIDVLENYVLKWKLRGGIWTRDEDWTLPTSGYEPDPRLDAAALLRRINGVRRAVMLPLRRLQGALKASETFGGKLRALYGLTEALGLAERIDDKAEALRADGELQLGDAYAQLWELIVRAMDQFYEILGDARGSTPEFARLWKLLISQYDMGAIPVALDRTSLGALSRIRRRGGKCLIVIGATDDALPERTGGETLLSESERRDLTGLGLPFLSLAEDRLYRSLNLVYSALTIPSDRLVVTWPKAGAGGGEKRPSFVVRRLAALFSMKAETDHETAFRLGARVPAFELAASSARNTENAAAAAAKAYFDGDPAVSQTLRRVALGADLRRDAMTPAQAARLYGRTLTVSASRIDKFYACRFLYFLQYGLNARPRRPAGFDAPTAGTFMHYLLENVTREIRDGSGFAETDESACRALTAKYVDAYVAEVLDNFKDKSSRFVYLFKRLAKDAGFIVLDMVRELASSDFSPVDFELEFSETGRVPPYGVAAEGAAVKVKGFVDRVDGFARDGKLYLRVVDYKTGKKAFSLSDVTNGLNMQMLIYLFALCRGGNRLFQGELVPAGVLYAPARETIVPASRDATPEEIDTERAKKLRRSGMILGSAEIVEAMEHGAVKRYLPVRLAADMTAGECLASLEQLDVLSQYIDGKLLEIAEGVSSGSVAAEPYYKGPSDNACLFCDFAAACHFSVEDGDRRRYMRKLATAEAWEKIMG